MLASGERDDDDLFGFSKQIFGESAEDLKAEAKKPGLTTATEVQTSYILVNALLSLLIRKGVIYSHEVNALVAELHADYIKKKRGE